MSAAHLTDAASSASTDEQELLSRGERIEKLLDDVRALAGPTTWPRVEELVKALVDLYGAGLTRLLACARSSASAPASLDAELTQDDFLAGLLTLHGLHPLDMQRRVEEAIARLKREVPTLPAKMELLSVEPDRARLRLVEIENPELARSLAQLARQAILNAAPELSEVEIEGLSAAPGQPSNWVSVERLRTGGRS